MRCPQHHSKIPLSALLPGFLLRMLLLGVNVYAGSDSLTLLNGDVIQGRFEKLQGTSLQFKPLWAHETVGIPAAFAGNLQFSSGKPDVPFRDVRLEFVSGGHLQGRLLDVNDNAVVFKTTWGQVLTTRREFIHRLLFLPDEENILFQGTFDDGQWELAPSENDASSATVEGNLLTLRGPTHAGFTLPPLPEKMVVEFSVRNLMQANGFNFELLARGPPGRLQEGLSFMFGGNWLVARMSQPRGRNRQLFRGTLGHAIQEGEWTRFRFLCDLKTNQIQIWLDGEYYHTFHYDTEADPVDKDQFKIRFLNRNPSTVVEVSDLVVWKTTAAFPEIQIDGLNMPDPGYLRLHNGDVLNADLTEIDKGWVHVQLPQGENISLRRDRVDHITLQAEGHIQPKRRERDVLVRLAGSSDSFTLRLLSLDSEGLTGESDYFVEPLKIPPAFLQQVEFNIHQRIRFDRGMQRQEPLVFLSLDPMQMDGGA